MADPICRWRNSSPKTVCELISQLPKQQLSSTEFREIMLNSIYGESFISTAYQLACQLGLYKESDGIYTPRFCRDISEEEAKIYLENWFPLYYVPNPYTKRGFSDMKEPVYIEQAFIEYLKNHNYFANFRDICKEVFHEEINNVDILVNCFKNYSKVISVDKYLNTTLAFDYEQILKNRIMNRIDKDAFFNNFITETRTPSVPAASGPLQLIYYGAPGTGKSYEIDGEAKDEVTVRTTFHPDSDYAGFVGAYKPTMQSLPMSYISEGIAKYAKAWNNHDGLERKIVYKYVPQAFLKAYVKAWGNIANFYETGEYHYLVIEEINRGNCAQIFGDLFQLLDRNNQGSSSYAIDADADIAQFLETDDEGFAKFTDEQRSAIREFVLVKDSGKELAIGGDILSGKKLLLPPNLRIWATMNTSDQSLFPIDSAFKRRWNWRYVPIDYTKKNHSFLVGENRYSWGDFLRKMNPIIAELTESPDKQMGYFFAKPDMKSDASLRENDTISEEIFLNKVLFYLWTDVLKDFDMSDNKFINPDTNRAYEFSDFFDPTHNYLQQFIDGVFA